MNRDALRKEIVNFVGEKRLPHVLGTEKECLELAGIFGMSDADREKLAFAALLHDITKSFSPEEHEQFAESRHICLPAANTDSPKTLHAVTGAYMAEELFPDDADETVFSAIRWHTTGKAGMTLTEKLMYLADFIEPTRTFPDCVRLRGYFYSRIGENDKNAVLDSTLILSFDMTVTELISSGQPIHPDTVAARNCLILKQKPGNES